jgi:DNA-binding transcriptional LysR family regulator
MVDIVGHGFDAGVRFEEFVPPDMIAVPITRPIRSIVVGSPPIFRGAGGQRLQLSWRSTAAFADARGTGRSIAGNLKSAVKPSPWTSRAS